VITLNLTIYSTKLCKNCKTLKEALDEANLAWEEKPIGSTTSLVELRTTGCFCEEAPVLVAKYVLKESGPVTRFYTPKTIFRDGATVNPALIRRLTRIAAAERAMGAV
jgi:glutaredoxin